VTIAYGMTPAGFVLKPVTVILAEYTADLLALIDPTTDVSPDVPLGQLLGIGSKKLGEVWQLAQVASNATNRADAEDALLENIGSITGTFKLGQTPCAVPCTAAFSLAGTYAAGSLVAYVTGAPSQSWSNQQALVVPGITNDGTGNPIGVAHPFTFSAANGNAQSWISTTDGPIYGAALNAANILLGHLGSLSQQVPVAGWLPAFADAGGVTLGTLEELDPPFRVRQYQELSAPGSSTLDAIEAAILAALAPLGLTPPPSVQMYENTKLTTDANGLPGKSFLAVVFDGAIPNYGTNDPLIASAIFNNKPAGMQSFGTYGFVYADPTSGKQWALAWTRPTQIPIYASMTLAVAASMTSAQRVTLAATTAIAINAASQGQPFTLYGTTFTPQQGAPTTLVPGEDVVVSALKSVAQGQSGVIDVTSFAIATIPAPVATVNIPITIGEVATLAVADIIVAVETFTP
jgi:hypothetical protein